MVVHKNGKNKKGMPHRISLLGGIAQLAAFLPAAIALGLPWFSNDEDSRFKFRWGPWSLKVESRLANLKDASRSWSEVCSWADTPSGFCGRQYLLMGLSPLVVIGCFAATVFTFSAFCQRKRWMLIIGSILSTAAWGLEFFILILAFAVGPPPGLSSSAADGGMTCVIIGMLLLLAAAASKVAGVCWWIPPISEYEEQMEFEGDPQKPGAQYGGGQPVPVYGNYPPQPYGQPAPMTAAAYGVAPAPGAYGAPSPGVYGAPGAYGGAYGGAAEGSYGAAAPNGYGAYGPAAAYGAPAPVAQWPAENYAAAQWPAAPEQHGGFAPVPVAGYGYHAGSTE